MARTREFDLTTALDQAMRVFWRKGYAATAMSDIYAATGLKPGSVYAAFRDKEGLFQQVFEHYAGIFRATLPTDRQGLAAIRAWIELQAKLAAEDSDRAGCLIVNTVAEREAHSPATQAMAQGRMREIRDFFVRHLVIAAQSGELPPDTDIDLRADALVGTVVSIMTLGRAGADAATIHHVAEAALEPFRGKK
ncbi:MAG: TetR/AcrR family transcriptional regulator [Hyphomonadaceae bacterium]|nr:TetR/AcrR family transcriptional regulator [Hyphomonadaceae bacterium]